MWTFLRASLVQHSTKPTVLSFILVQISYAIPLLLRVTVARNTFRKGDFHLGWASVPMTWIAALWLSITSLFFFWPPSSPTSVMNMNWTIVVVGELLRLAIFTGT